MTRTLAFAAAAIAATFAASPAMAQEERSAEVYYADLNLADDAGLSHFDGRIREAIRRVCRYGATPDRIDQQAEQRCKRETGARVILARNEAVRIARSGERRDPSLAVLRIAAEQRH